MNERTPNTEGWRVWTDSDVFTRDFSSRAVVWHWAAYGGRGYKSGCEMTAGEAQERAQAAAWLLRAAVPK